MKICSVIVTYGDRFHLLSQVIEACYKEGVDKVIVVDNASEKNSRDKLQEFANNYQNRLKAIYLDENTGSAGGYKRGLKEAYWCEECEYIWLLDDDNQPQRDSLKVLKEFWNTLEDENKKEKISLLAYRPDRIAYKEAIMTNNPDLVLGRKNSFLGFHILELPKKVLRVIKRKLGIKTFKEDKNIKSGKVAVAPYGGMFFHKNIIDAIRYPREEFFVYADDHEWSYRITKNGGSIYLLLNSLVDDIDTSWGLIGAKNTSLLYSLMNKGDNFRLYYSTRNRVAFENYINDSTRIYMINKLIFNFLLKFYINKNNFKKYKIYKLAISDGQNNNFSKYDQ